MRLRNVCVDCCWYLFCIREIKCVEFKFSVNYKGIYSITIDFLLKSVQLTLMLGAVVDAIATVF